MGDEEIRAELERAADGGLPTLRLARDYRHPPERVWGAIVDDGAFSTWFGLARQIDGAPAAGTRLTMTFPGGEPEEGKILDVVPGQLLSFSWGEEMLRFEVGRETAGASVRFTTTVQDPDHISHSAAGYHLALAGLALYLDGAAGQPVDEAALPSFEELAEHYGARW